MTYHQIAPLARMRGLDLLSPPRTLTEGGQERRIGVEMEFAGLETAAAADLVQSLFGGEIFERDPYRYEVRETPFGTFVCELDSQYVHPDKMAPGKAGKAADFLAKLRGHVAEVFGDVSSRWLPVEIVAPPMPLSHLGEMEGVLEALRQKGAEGTGDSVVYAFALQFNPEAVRLDAEYILSVMRAYLLLEDWLKARIVPDNTRRLLQFATDFPGEWGRFCLRPDYAPSLASLIGDYARFNPSRNRGLDLYPLFAHLDEPRVRRLAGDPLIKPRPTFHYRLPDARLSDPDWCLACEWNDWVQVELLAEDRARLSAMADAWLRLRGRSQPGSRARWAREAEQWLTP